MLAQAVLQIPGHPFSEIFGSVILSPCELHVESSTRRSENRPQVGVPEVPVVVPGPLLVGLWAAEGVWGTAAACLPAALPGRPSPHRHFHWVSVQIRAGSRTGSVANTVVRPTAPAENSPGHRKPADLGVPIRCNEYETSARTQNGQCRGTHR